MSRFRWTNSVGRGCARCCQRSRSRGCRRRSPRWPRESSSSHRCEPRNPAPPVTRLVGIAAESTSPDGPTQDVLVTAPDRQPFGVEVLEQRLGELPRGSELVAQRGESDGPAFRLARSIDLLSDLRERVGRGSGGSSRRVRLCRLLVAPANLRRLARSPAVARRPLVSVAVRPPGRSVRAARRGAAAAPPPSGRATGAGAHSWLGVWDSPRLRRASRAVVSRDGPCLRGCASSTRRRPGCPAALSGGSLAGRLGGDQLVLHAQLPEIAAEPGHSGWGSRACRGGRGRGPGRLVGAQLELASRRYVGRSRRCERGQHVATFHLVGASPARFTATR